MVACGCERNVITYSSLISACEKAGRWELALELFNEMHREGCKPNVVTYNSLIAACAQGEFGTFGKAPAACHNQHVCMALDAQTCSRALMLAGSAMQSQWCRNAWAVHPCPDILGTNCYSTVASCTCWACLWCSILPDSWSAADVEQQQQQQYSAQTQARRAMLSSIPVTFCNTMQRNAWHQNWGCFAFGMTGSPMRFLRLCPEAALTDVTFILIRCHGLMQVHSMSGHHSYSSRCKARAANQIP